MIPLIANKVKTTYTTVTITITACSIFFSHNSVFCSQWRSSNHDYFVHQQLHTRLTEFLLTAERSQNWIFIFLLSRGLYTDFIVVVSCVFSIHCLCVRVTLCNKLVIVVAIAFVYCYYMKRYQIVSICVIICTLFISMVTYFPKLF